MQRQHPVPAFAGRSRRQRCVETVGLTIRPEASARTVNSRRMCGVYGERAGPAIRPDLGGHDHAEDRADTLSSEPTVRNPAALSRQHQNPFHPGGPKCYRDPVPGSGFVEFRRTCRSSHPLRQNI